MMLKSLEEKMVFMILYKKSPQTRTFVLLTIFGQGFFLLFARVLLFVFFHKYANGNWRYPHQDSS